MNFPGAAALPLVIHQSLTCPLPLPSLFPSPRQKRVVEEGGQLGWPDSLDEVSEKCLILIGCFIVRAFIGRGEWAMPDAPS